jgi:hypothetical protein
VGSPTEGASAAAHGPGGKALNPNPASQGIIMQARPLLVSLFTVVIAIVGFASITAAMVMTVASR